MNEVMNRLKYDLRIMNGSIYPADYFEMMGGVGFGGWVMSNQSVGILRSFIKSLIAVLLGCFRLTVKQAMDEFHLLASALFSGNPDDSINPSINAENLRKFVERLLERRNLPIDIELDDQQLQVASCKVSVD
jgi:hypothetical protein